jgi:Acetyltransferases, including N-acetylases of ribosomal proteins
MLENESIKLRAPEPEDLDWMYKWENNTQLWVYGSTIAPFSRYTLKEYIANGGDFYEVRQMRLMIVARASDEVIGAVDLFDYDPFNQRCAVGILIDESWRCRNMATQALELICRYAFDFLSMHMLFAYVSSGNEASIRLFEKCSFQKSGVLKDWLRIYNQFEDAIIFQRINK